MHGSLTPDEWSNKSSNGAAQLAERRPRFGRLLDCRQKKPSGGAPTALVFRTTGLGEKVEVLRRLRHGGQQFVRVEHVHVNDGGQAVIGNLKNESSA